MTFDELYGGIIEPTSKVFKQFCEDHGLRIFTLGADKHGSLVWEASQAISDQEGLYGMITWAVTPVDQGLFVSIMIIINDEKNKKSNVGEREVRQSPNNVDYLAYLNEGHMVRELTADWEDLLKWTPEDMLIDRRHPDFFGT